MLWIPIDCDELVAYHNQKLRVSTIFSKNSKQPSHRVKALRQLLVKLKTIDFDTTSIEINFSLKFQIFAFCAAAKATNPPDTIN